MHSLFCLRQDYYANLLGKGRSRVAEENEQGKASHPIEGLMKTAMESLKEMVDVNTILGNPVETPDGNVIVPVSRVSVGFAAGGTEFEVEGDQSGYPFGGGSGAGISLQPVAFLVVGQGQTRLLPIDKSAIYDRLLDMAPELVDRLQNMMSNGQNRRVQAPVGASPPL